MCLRHIIILFFLVYSLSYSHQNFQRTKVWNEDCPRKSILLNDCNWCKCIKGERYECDPKPCSAVDMFGHFKDAIQDIKVGMEGHGAWRSESTPCSPGVHYQRGGILCVCNEEGHWPNPICRDLFRVLYSVELTDLTTVSGNESCLANKLYVVDCNVCICPSTEVLDAQYCTKNKCEFSPTVVKESAAESDDVEEIYATCDTNSSYLLGCRRCKCLISNRLVCDNCLDRVNKIINKSYCNNQEAGKVFNLDCNLCYCDSESNMFCTARKCLQAKIEDVKRIIDTQTQMRDSHPSNSNSCDVGMHNKDCNKCRCIKNDNDEYFLDCSAEYCEKNAPVIHESCVENTAYELNCMICTCVVINNRKRQVCINNLKCVTDESFKEKRSQDMQKMHGYCEPLHIYRNGCNRCQCLADGKTLKCTSKICDVSEPVTVEVVPYRLDSGEPCPPGQSYQLNCNYCFCLLNGNSICTTLDCNK